MDQIAHFVPRSELENQYVKDFAIGGNPIDWNQPFAPQKNAKSHNKIVADGNPKNVNSPGVTNRADKAKQIFAIALIISAVGMNVLTLALSAKMPLMNFPIP